MFGSLARGKASRRSDVDLILIQNTSKRFFDRYDGLLQNLSTAIRYRDVDIFIYTPNELQEISHRSFITRALKEGKVIYKRGEKS